MSGKGDSPRPLSVSDEEFGKRFDAIDWSDRGPERATSGLDDIFEVAGAVAIGLAYGKAVLDGDK